MDRLNYISVKTWGQPHFPCCTSKPLWYNPLEMQRKSQGQVAYYTFDSLYDSGTLIHAISTRHGGVSSAPFLTLNLSRTTGDDATNVAMNIQRLHDALGLDATATISASQAQVDRVAVVGAAQRGTIIREVDALLTNEPGVPLMLRYADCVPIFLFDPVHRAIGVAHAGWRGTVGKIATKTARAMVDAFGTQPRDLIACIAPSIGPCCYRIGEDVSAQVRAAFVDADELLIAQAGGGVHLDLWKANAQQLRELGVEQIEITGICTADHTDDFYSWRAENAKTGRFGAIIALSD
jgi:YfiH family protein